MTTIQSSAQHSGSDGTAALPARPAINQWDLVRPMQGTPDLLEQMNAGVLNLGDVFGTRGSTWLVCGWYSAVGHVLGLSTTGERKVISCHEDVSLMRRATPEETAALKEDIQRR